MKRNEILTVLMGIIISITGIYFLIRDINGDVQPVPGEVLSDVMLIVGGACVALFFRKDLRNGTALSMFTLGASMVAGNIYYALEASEDTQTIFSDVYLILSAVMIYYSISLVFHSTAGSTKGLVCIGVLALIEFGPMCYRIYLGADVIPTIGDNIDNLVSGIMHLTVVFILTRKGMLLETPTKRLNRNSKLLSDNMCSPSQAFIDVHDIDTILDDSQGWTQFDKGPIISQKTIRLYNTDVGLDLQRWKGDDRTYLSVRVLDVDSYEVPLSFPIESIVLDDEDRSNATRMRFYGNDGVFVDIVIKDFEKEKKGYIDTVKQRYGKNRKKDDPVM